MITFEDTLIAPPLRIRFCPGNSDRLIVCFSGVGNKRHQEPPIEFFKTIDAGVPNPVLFISDQNRSWLNTPGMDTSILNAIQETRERIRANEVAFIGNSMGASMALFLANQIDVDCVIAFTPQYSVNPTILPEENRWGFFREKIEKFHYRSLDNWPDQTTTFVLHGSSPDEQMHAKKFPAAPENVSHFILRGFDHRLAEQLKSTGTLKPLVNAMMQRKPRRVRKILLSQNGIRANRFRYTN